MKALKHIATLCILGILVCITVSCGKDDDDIKIDETGTNTSTSRFSIVGTWTGTGTGSNYKLTFNSSGSGSATYPVTTSGKTTTQKENFTYTCKLGVDETKGTLILKFSNRNDSYSVHFVTTTSMRLTSTSGKFARGYTKN